MTKKEIKQKIKALIAKSFPRLKRPWVFFVKRDDAFMLTGKHFGFYFLFIEEEVLAMNENAVVGCLVHELCHINNWNEEDERVIDQMVIDKGYCKELYALVSYHDEYYKKYNKKDGLTKREIHKQLSA